MKAQRYHGILADLDGTMNRGNRLIPGAAETYARLSNNGLRWVFLSNSASRSASGLADKMRNLGVPVSNEQFVNSATALIRGLHHERPQAKVFVVGEQPFIAALLESGIEVVDDPKIADTVVSAMDRKFTYEKLSKAHEAISGGAVYWATNTDPSYPAEVGFRPGSGSIVAAISTAAGHPPDRVFGKPFSDMAHIALELLGLLPDECIVVGDRMETDILFARNAGIDSALVLTTTREDLPLYDYEPNYILDSISLLDAVLKQ
jgi:HAD superfamily hydrolase (TIGR01450 family)